MVGVASHVPGGVGVFETMMLLAFKDHIPLAGLTAALIGYRFIYYVAPLLCAKPELRGAVPAEFPGYLDVILTRPQRWTMSGSPAAQSSPR